MKIRPTRIDMWSFWGVDGYYFLFCFHQAICWQHLHLSCCVTLKFGINCLLGVVWERSLCSFCACCQISQWRRCKIFRALIGGKAEEITFLAVCGKILQKMPNTWNAFEIIAIWVAKPFHIRSNPQKRFFYMSCSFWGPFLFFFVSAWCFGWFSYRCFVVFAVWALFGPHFFFLLGLSVLIFFFFGFLLFLPFCGFLKPHDCPTIAHDYPRLPHDCPRSPTIAPRLPTIAHDCSTIAHDCPRLPTTAQSAKNFPKRQKTQKNQKQISTKNAKKTTRLGLRKTKNKKQKQNSKNDKTCQKWSKPNTNENNKMGL